MRRSTAIPSSNLLEQIEGVEETLRKGRRIGALGGTASVIFGAAEVAVTATQRLKVIDWKQVGGLWPFLVPLLLLALSLGAANWTRFWIRESRSPFRYTYSVAEFVPISSSERAEAKMEWLCSDLRVLFSRRIGRLSWLEGSQSDASAGTGPTAAEGEDAGAGREAHIHVSGSYVIRAGAIEVTPWVRVGAPSEPSRLAHPVRFNMPPKATPQPPWRASIGAAIDEPPLTQVQYQRLVERVFFSVATEIYAQIRTDVQRKVDLLPNDRFRAAAYFYEAEDYARSNTLHAYTVACELYSQAIRLYQPSWIPDADVRWRRGFQRIRRGLAHAVMGIRKFGSRAWPRLGRIPLLVSRAEIGYANMVLYRRAFSGMSGQRLNSVFEVRPVATEAVERLKDLRENISGRRDALFDAYVALGLMWTFLRSRRRAEAALAEARDLMPLRAEQDARFLFASGMAEPRVLSKLPLFRRSVELDPEFEVAHFQLGLFADKALANPPHFGSHRRPRLRHRLLSPSCRPGSRQCFSVGQHRIDPVAAGRRGGSHVRF